ncbi:MAG: Chemotaxis response regulator protein-glutamate methylesterase CheB [Myxococcaceae bacterium]|nr:Chemotaxis response regulator protein-glutamate methylesterase CheB [Myxococcaceae bacterium]
MSGKLRVMVVDDSALNRRTIGDVLGALEGVEVVGKAADGDEALRLAASLTPDLITLDLEMPRMDGYTFLRLLMARQPTPVIVISGSSGRDSVGRALELGAIDYVAKSTRSDAPGIEGELAEKVANLRQLAMAGRGPMKRVAHAALAIPPRPVVKPPAPVYERPGSSPTVERERERDRDSGLTRLVVIGASTGGPSALVEVFSQVRQCANTAIVVAQHMPERFTRTFAERLNRLSILRVSEAREFEPLHPGRALLCPGGKCLEITTFGHGFAALVVDPAPSDRFIPSADRLFKSAAEVAREKVVGVVLTGMGDDGARGVVAIKARGGTVLAESAETAVIYGMPGAAVRTGDVDKTLPLGALAAYLAELIV